MKEPLAAILPVPLLVLLTTLAYSNALSAGLALDSTTLVLKDPRIRATSLANLRQVFEHSYYWPSQEAGLYRPFTTLSFWWNYSILGSETQPAGYHWLNLLLHVANVVLAYLLVRRVIGRTWIPFLIAAVWGVHPLLTEAVSNVSGRADLLACFGVLLGLLLYLKAREATGWRRAGFLVGLFLSTIVGVFSKENAVVIAVVILAYELLWRQERRDRILLWGLLATGVPIAAMLYLRWLVLSNSPPSQIPFVDNPIAWADFIAGRGTALSVMLRYSLLMVWPVNLSSDYSFAAVPLLPMSTAVALACVALGLIAVALFAALRSERATLFFLSFSFLAFLPVSNFLFPIGTIMAERLMYLPSLGLIACGTLWMYAGLARWKSPELAGWILFALIPVLGSLTWGRNLDWQNDATILSADAAKRPSSFKLHKQMASTLYDSDPSHVNISDAIQEAERSLAPLNELPDVLNIRDPYRQAGGYYLIAGTLSHRTEEFDRAKILLLRGVAIQSAARAAYDQQINQWRALGDRDAYVPLPDDSEIYQLLAAAYFASSDAQRGLDATREALIHIPQTAQAYREIAGIFLDANRQDDAAAALIQGMLLVSPDLQNDLKNLYKELGIACAVVPGSTLQGQCAAVQRHFCAAEPTVIAAFQYQGLREKADAQRRSIAGYHCSP